MISLEEIEREISEIKATRDTSYYVCERLAWLFICRNNLRQDGVESSTEARAALGGSEFMQLASSVPYERMMGVLDEHMDVLKALYPKSYSAIIDKLKAMR